MGRMWMFRGFRVWSICNMLMDQGWLAFLLSSLVLQLDALFIRSVRTINNISFHPKAQKQIMSPLYCELLIYFSKEPNLMRNPLKLAPVMSRMLLPKLKFVDPSQEFLLNGRTCILQQRKERKKVLFSILN